RRLAERPATGRGRDRLRVDRRHRRHHRHAGHPRRLRRHERRGVHVRLPLSGRTALRPGCFHRWHDRRGWPRRVVSPAKLHSTNRLSYPNRWPDARGPAPKGEMIMSTLTENRRLHLLLLFTALIVAGSYALRAAGNNAGFPALLEVVL